MLEIIENIKKYSGLPSIIPIITSHDYVSIDHDLIHPQLSADQDIDIADLPNFFALNAFEWVEDEGTEIPWELKAFD